LAHANPQVTATVYTHLVDDSQLDRFAAALDTLGDTTVRETVREAPRDAKTP
jgi:hypothetical protein